MSIKRDIGRTLKAMERLTQKCNQGAAHGSLEMLNAETFWINLCRNRSGDALESVVRRGP
jgi:hypothetical protein